VAITTTTETPPGLDDEQRAGGDGEISNRKGGVSR
jgi:hypothetical protein